MMSSGLAVPSMDSFCTGSSGQDRVVPEHRPVLNVSYSMLYLEALDTGPLCISPSGFALPSSE